MTADAPLRRSGALRCGFAASTAALGHGATTPAQLRDALESAAASPKDETLRLVRGGYVFSTTDVLGVIEGDLVLRNGHARGSPPIGRSLDAATSRLRAFLRWREAYVSCPRSRPRRPRRNCS